QLDQRVLPLDARDDRVWRLQHATNVRRVPDRPESGLGAVAGHATAVGPGLAATWASPGTRRYCAPATAEPPPTRKRPLSLRPKTSGKNDSSMWAGAT